MLSHELRTGSQKVSPAGLLFSCRSCKLRLTRRRARRSSGTCTWPSTMPLESPRVIATHCCVRGAVNLVLQTRFCNVFSRDEQSVRFTRSPVRFSRSVQRAELMRIAGIVIFFAGAQSSNNGLCLIGWIFAGYVEWFWHGYTH